MDDVANPVIKLKLDHSIKLNYTMCATGDKGTIISTNKKSLLSIGRLYEIPITFVGDMDEYNVVKLYGTYSEKFSIRNIRDGFAIIQPLVNNIVIKDEEEIGILI